MVVQDRIPWRPALLLPLLLLASMVSVSGVSAQPARPVRFTRVANHPVRGSVQLPGTVLSRLVSVVASEVAALVIELEVEEGERVPEGKAIARLRTVNFDLMLLEAKGRLKESQARLELADSKLERARELFDDEVISQDELDDAYFEYIAWQGRVDQTVAEIKQLEVALDRCVIRAPFDGIVVAKRTEVGQWMDDGGDVIELMSLSQIEVGVDVPERVYDRLALGTEVRVTFEALPGFEETGRIDRIIPRADPQARTFPIRVRIPNRDDRIGVGMLASVDLPTGTAREARLVPKDAIVRQGEREVVFRIGEDEAVEVVTVRTGQGFGAWVAVEGPLQTGERVVTRGNERLQPGDVVRGDPLEYTLP